MVTSEVPSGPNERAGGDDGSVSHRLPGFLPYRKGPDVTAALLGPRWSPPGA